VTRHTHGFTLVELLIVIAIIGILSFILIPRLLASRQNAVNRASQAYASNVYKSASAYIAEDVSNTVSATDCTNGFSIGSYSVSQPGNGIVQSCALSVGVAGLPAVNVVSTYGAQFVF
jgi:prepilin-type N-terminal cleavage/methylation domain-containing protein